MPHPHKIVDSKVLVPGCVLEITVAVRATERRASFISVYLPPDSRGEVLAALQASPRPGTQEVYAGGDVNLQMHSPQDDGEQNDGELLQRIVAALGACLV